jgi:SAM-dependent methyltransferase
MGFSIKKLKNSIRKRLYPQNVDAAVRDFKTRAWQSPEGSNRYHDTTKEAPQIFQVIRQDLYIDRVRRYAPAGARILDLGCGSGLVSLALADLGYDVVSCDVSRDMLNVLERERGDRRIETRCGDAYAIPAADGEFDMVISRMFIQHFVDWPKIVVEKARVTRPGGVVMFDFGNREHLDASGLNPAACKFPYGNDPKDSGTFYAVASEEEMREAARAAGLSVEEISPAGLLLYNGFLWIKLGAEGIAEFNRTLDELLVRDGAREMLELIERSVLPLLPKATTYNNFTVLRK